MNSDEQEFARLQHNQKELAFFGWPIHSHLKKQATMLFNVMHIFLILTLFAEIGFAKKQDFQKVPADAIYERPSSTAAIFKGSWNKLKRDLLSPN